MNHFHIATDNLQGNKITHLSWKNFLLSIASRKPSMFGLLRPWWYLRWWQRWERPCAWGDGSQQPPDLAELPGARVCSQAGRNGFDTSISNSKVYMSGLKLKYDNTVQYVVTRSERHFFLKHSCFLPQKQEHLCHWKYNLKTLFFYLYKYSCNSCAEHLFIENMIS